MSFFSSKSSNQFTSVADRALEHPEEPLFGPLEPNDLFWTCAGGFVTETQNFYCTRPSGQVVLFQVIHSAVGLWNPNIQLTFALFDPSNPAKQRTWKSINVNHFKTAPAPNLDKRSCRGDQFSITCDPAKPDVYILQGTYDNDVQVSLTITRAPNCPGWKLGPGRRGGMSYFGSVKAPSNVDSKDPDTAAGSDGYVIHRVWPRTFVSGIVRVGGNVIDMEGSRGMMVHAIQGMRPNLVASRWNFADFQSSADDGTSLVLSEFTTTSAHGKKVVTVGSIVVDDKLVSVVVGGTPFAGEGASAQHRDVFLDTDTGYNTPTSILFTFEGPLIEDLTSTAKAALGEKTSKATVKATLDMQLGDKGQQGLMEKVDVLAEIPYFIKKVVNVVSGAKPYIYQWLNPITATIQLPAHNGQEAKELKVQGHLFSEASYVSETP